MLISPRDDKQRKRLVFARIATTSSRNSFFSAISTIINGTLVISVLPMPNRKEYVVIAKPSGNVDKYTIKDLGTKKEQSKIEQLKLVRLDKYTYIVALKSRCEFYEIAESNNILIMSPYSITRGMREFYAAGDLNDIAKYFDELSYYYGQNNVSMFIERDVSRIVRDIEKAFTGSILWGLTGREVEVLKAAYFTGFLSHRRHVKMDHLVNSLGIKKSTLSIMIRKAISKILEELFESAS